MPDHKNREHALLSASSAHRWLACPPSAVAAELYPEQDTEFTREGTLAHEVAEVYARRSMMRYQQKDKSLEVWADGKGEDPEMRKCADPEMRKCADPEMRECAEGYADYIWEQVTSPDAVVLLEQRVDFSPWVPDGFGTCDCIILQGDDMTIIDYKYGQGVAVSADNNPQMMLYALGALNDYGIAYDIRQVHMHIYQPRINNISAYTIDADALMRWAEYVVKPTAAMAAKGKGKYSAGEHCRFCPHAGRCRELTNVCSEFVETHDLRVAVPVLSQTEVADVLRMESLISLWLKKVKAQAMTTLLDGGEIPGYKVVEGRLGNRTWTDELAVAQALKDAGYQINDITETKLLSPAAMDKSIGKNKVAELLEGLISRSPGAPTIVPDTDKRPTLDRLAEAQKDFE